MIESTLFFCGIVISGFFAAGVYTYFRVRFNNLEKHSSAYYHHMHRLTPVPVRTDKPHRNRPPHDYQQSAEA